MRSAKAILLLFIIITGAGCSIVQPGKTVSKNEDYSEDLSAYRAEFAAEESISIDTVAIEHIADSATADVTKRLNTVLDTAAVYARATTRYIDGFTIQVYGGDDRNQAKEKRIELIRHFPETKPKMVFEQPNYKVRVGLYYTRLEAQHLYTQVKSYFPRAILIPKRIYIK